jgi:CubicO group peptidase (beta-lactamase class C family)
MRTCPLSSLLLLSLCTWAQTQNDQVSLPQHLESLVNDRFEATRCPGLSVAVASHNQIVFSKALGKADIEQGVPLTTASVQRLASLSKPITGTIIMDLVEQGKLALDVSVRQYLPELPAFYQSVTLRELLSHQSGVRGYADEESVLFSTIHYATSRDALKAMMTYPLAFTPGNAGDKVGILVARFHGSGSSRRNGYRTFIPATLSGFLFQTRHPWLRARRSLCPRAESSAGVSR